MLLTDMQHQSTPHPDSSLPFTTSFSHWQEDPLQAFDNWMANKKFARSTAKVYGYMWGRLMSWMSEKGLPLDALQSRDLQGFLDGQGLTKHHRYRYVRLVERIYDHLAVLRPGLQNPGSKAAVEKVGRGMNAPTAFLDKQQRGQLIKWLSKSDIPQMDALERAARWREIRDRAIAGAILGGGLKGVEVRGMSVSNILSDGEWLEVWNAAGRKHRTRLAPFARELLARWVTVRREMRIPGRLLFPSAPTGAAMTRMTLYRIVHRQLEAAGITLASREAPQTLRNTFAAIQFDAGESDAVVTEYMGLQEVYSATRMRLSYLQGGAAA